MEREPLLPYTTPRKPPPPQSPPPPPSPITLPPLPEEDEYSIPSHIITTSTTTHDLSSSLTPKELKDFLIFGPASPSASSPISHTHIDSSSFLNDSVHETPSIFIRNNSLHNVNNHSIASSSSCSTPKKFNLDQQNQQQSWLLDPNQPWEKHHLHRSKTAPAMAVINDKSNSSVDEQPQFGSQSIVRQSFVLLILYLCLGVVIYSCFREHFNASETHPVVDALYFCIVTMCTIGYGDITPASTPTKLFSIFFVLIGFGFIDILLSGMVTYVLDLQENYLLKTMKAGGAHDPGRYIIDVKKGRMRIRMKVGLALGVVVLCTGIGATVMHFVERLNWLDSFYLSVMSVTTVGYGDRAFTSMPGRLFACVWLLVSTLAVARAFLYLAEARVDKRHRRVAKWVLDQNMTVSQFLAADIDNNGAVSKSEYVVYKLKQMGKVTEKDIMLICKQFERLDSGNNGKITLADLMEGRH